MSFMALAFFFSSGIISTFLLASIKLLSNVQVRGCSLPRFQMATPNAFQQYPRHMSQLCMNSYSTAALWKAVATIWTKCFFSRGSVQVWSVCSQASSMNSTARFTQERAMSCFPIPEYIEHMLTNVLASSLYYSCKSMHPISYSSSSTNLRYLIARFFFPDVLWNTPRLLQVVVSALQALKFESRSPRSRQLKYQVFFRFSTCFSAFSRSCRGVSLSPILKRFMAFVFRVPMYFIRYNLMRL
ncbi:hypothetical protein FGO68_gene11820 [Halteria grandinella]|uniref:Uncharacterized protein n=1 Tax=Halteria grandinella TaxID=5974 RepID=A0A8J8P0C9_HALGN|nr:hypothetical protein FGO68_gene11820 [Halteria grandinella]